MNWRVLVGDVREKLAELPSESVQTCITSPPYWLLRDYGCDEQIGLEQTPDAYVARLVDVFRDVRRVLKDDGVLWLNLGSSYFGGGGSYASERHSQGTDVDGMAWLKYTSRLKPKDMVPIPWMVAMTLQADSWYLRSDIIWHKPNPMPESVTDRPTKSHEYVFLLSKSEHYYYDADAIAEPCVWRHGGQRVVNVDTPKNRALGLTHSRPRGHELDGGRNCRSVWSIGTQNYSEMHFATFPEALPERCIKAGLGHG